MELILICGSNDNGVVKERQKAIGHERAERIDVALDGGAALLEAVAAPALFGPRRVVDAVNFDQLGASEADRLNVLAQASDTRVVASCPKVSAALKRKLPRHHLVEVASLDARTLPAALGRHCREKGVQLTPELSRLIAQRCADRPNRALQIVDQLAMVGSRSPNRRQVEALLGTTRPKVKPWDIGGWLEGGRVQEALEVAAVLPTDDLFALTGYLRKALLEVSTAMDFGTDGLDRRLNITPNKAATVARRAQSMDRGSIAAALGRLRDLDDALRASRDVGPALDLSLVAYGHCFGH